MTKPPRIPVYAKSKKGKYEYAACHINGRVHKLGYYGTEASREKYHRLIAEWFASGCSKRFGMPVHEVKVFELVDDYIHHCEETYGTGPNSEMHRNNFDVRWVKILCELYATLPATEFGGKEFKAVRHQLLQADLARSYINASMKRLVRMFKWAASEGMVPVTVFQALALVPGLRYGQARETAPVKPADESLVDATLPHLPPIVADMVRVQRLTGMRPAEVCIARPCDIKRAGDVWEYRPQRHKTLYRGIDRVVAIGPQAQAVLLRYLVREAKTYCFRPCDTVADFRAVQHAARKTPLSCGNVPGSNRKRKPKVKPGECFPTRSYHNAVAKACRKAFPVPDDLADDVQAVAEWRRKHRWSPNQLRHSAATDIRRRFGLEAAQVVLGHSRANVTQIYAERDSTLAIRIAKEVG